MGKFVILVDAVVFLLSPVWIILHGGGYGDGIYFDGLAGWLLITSVRGILEWSESVYCRGRWMEPIDRIYTTNASRRFASI